MISFNLADAMKIPLLGYGVYDISRDICQQCVEDALEIGYRLIDTAKYYKNEQEVGNAVKISNIKREDIFITSKIYSSGFDAAMKDIDDSLAKIGSYIDLMLIHWRIRDDINTYKALEQAKRDGKIKSIGISNYYGDNLKRIIDNAEIKPVLNQVECHIYHQQSELEQMLKQNNILMQAWSPFGGGQYAKDLLEEQTILNISKKYNKTSAQIIIRWLLERQISVIPKTIHKDRMKENIDVFNFTLDQEDIKLISNLDKKKSLFNWY